MRLRAQTPWRALLGTVRRDKTANMPSLVSAVRVQLNRAHHSACGEGGASEASPRDVRTRAGRPSSKGRDDLRTSSAWDGHRERQQQTQQHPPAERRYDARGGGDDLSSQPMGSPAARGQGEWPMAAEMQERIPLPSHVSEITSTANPLVKYCVRLRQSASFRLSTRRVLVAGAVPLRELCGHLSDARASHHTSLNTSSLLEAPPPPLELLFSLEDPQAALSGSNRDLAQAAQRVVRVSSSVMSKLSGVESLGPSHVAAILPLPPSFLSLAPTALPPPSRSSHQEEDDSASATGQSAVFSNWLPTAPKRVLVLDGVQDPGNVGTLVRTALAFNWDAVFLLSGCCDPFNEKALRASRGAAFRLPLASGEWQDCQALAAHFGMNIFAGEPGSASDDSPHKSLSSSSPTAAADPQDPSSPPRTADSTTAVLEQASTPEADTGKGLVVGDGSLAPREAQALLSRPLCLVLGSEGQGLSPAVSAAATPVSIRMPGNMESLNVGIAGGILMYLLALE